MDIWGKITIYISCYIRASNHWTFKSTPGKFIIGRDIISNLLKWLYLYSTTTGNKNQIDMDNYFKNASGIIYEYSVGDKL